jgi:hypothetical protein
MDTFNLDTLNRMWDTLHAAAHADEPDMELYLDAADALQMCLDRIDHLEQIQSNLRAELQRQRAMEGAGY